MNNRMIRSMIFIPLEEGLKRKKWEYKYMEYREQIYMTFLFWKIPKAQPRGKHKGSIFKIENKSILIC